MFPPAGPPPSPPSSITVPATDSDGNYAINWSTVSGATGYDLEEDTSSSFTAPTLVVNNQNVTTYNVTGKANGTTWYYRVRARNANGPSTWLNGSNGCQVIYIPNPPASITVPATSSTGSFGVTWSASTGATGYDLEEANNASFTGAALVVNNLNVTTYNVSGKTSGTWYYRVRARSSGGASAWTTGSNGCQIVAPNPPATLTVPGNSGTGNYTVSWSAVTGATGYDLEEDTSPTFGSAGNVYSGSATSLGITGKSIGVYYYRVRAYNGVGSSAWLNGPNGCTVGPPPAPATITVPPTSASGNFTVSWASSAGATGYDLEEANNSGFAGASLVVNNQNVTSYNAAGKTSGTWYYRVCARSSVGASAWTPGANGCQIVPPTAPASVAVPPTSMSGNYTVSWTASADATSYDLEEDTSSSFGNPSTVYTGAATSFNAAGKTSGTFYYRVRATGIAGNSGWTAGANGCQIIPPAAPASIAVPATSVTGNYQVSWPASTGTINYELQESTVSTFGTVNTVYTGANTYFDVTGKSSGTFYYRVRATNQAGNSAWTSETTGCTIVAPAAPVPLTVPASSSTGTYTITWGASAGATGYELQESATSAFTSTTSFNPGTNTSWTRSNRPNGTCYYRVRASNGAGNSPWTTDTVGCVVLLVAPSAPVAVTVPATSNTGSFTVSWTTVQGATSYEVEESTDAGFAGATSVYTGATALYGASGKANGTYYYRVKAGNTAGWSGWTAGGNGCVVNLSAPSAPSGLTVPASSNTGNYQVSWTAASGATVYELEEDTGGSFGSAVSLYGGAATSFDVTGRGNGTYYYRVRAVNAIGASGWTNGGNGCVVSISMGGLAVTAGPSNPAATNEKPGTTGIPALQVCMSAGLATGVTTQTLTVRATGSGDDSTELGDVKLWRDVDGSGTVTAGDLQVGTAQRFTADEGTVTFSMATSPVIPSGGSEWYLLTIDILSGATNGSGFSLGVTPSSDVAAVTTPGSVPVIASGSAVWGGVKTAALWGPGSLSVSLGANSPQAAHTYPVTGPVAVIQLTLAASSMEPLTVSGLRFGSRGSGDETSLGTVRLYEDVNRDGAVTGADFIVSTGTFSGDNGTLTFSGFVQPITASGSVTLLVAYEMQVAKAGTYGLSIDGAADVTALGGNSAEGIIATGLPVTGGLLTVDVPEKVLPAFFMGGCGAAGFGGPMPLLAPLLALAAAMALVRRRG